LLHPDVAQAVAFPVPDPKFGETVAAAVVLRPRAAVTAAELKRFAAGHIARYKVPQRILFVPSIPHVNRSVMAQAFGIEGLKYSAEVFPIRDYGAGVPLFILTPPRGLQVGVERPVFGIREPDVAHLPPPHTIEHVAAECIRALRQFRANGPYALACSEENRAVALEMARQLEQDGAEIDFVALFNSLSRADRVRGFVRRLTGGKNSVRYDRPHAWSGTTVYAESLF
jgi:hypothetical protein